MYSKLIYLFTILAILLSLGTTAPAAYADHENTVSGLRMILAAQLGEHVLLASSATGAALAGRQPQFEGAAAALDANLVDVSKTIGLVYGPEAEAAFLDLWRKHINLVVDYTTALAAKDQGKADQAVNALLAYTGEFGTFLNNANPNLSKEVVAELVEMHILTLKDVIDAQAAGDQTMVYSKLREAYNHMGMIANPVAAAISQQFPDRFGGVTAAMPAASTPAMAPAALPQTGGQLSVLEPIYLVTFLAVIAIFVGVWLKGRHSRSA
ncbi:MAG: hypothetical protein L6R45_05415 [Anaerolineae bacterium]|nr:hypothetical protein [Anaerolineae bacterium]